MLRTDFLLSLNSSPATWETLYVQQTLKPVKLRKTALFLCDGMRKRRATRQQANAVLRSISNLAGGQNGTEKSNVTEKRPTAVFAHFFA